MKRKEVVIKSVKRKENVKGNVSVIMKDVEKKNEKEKEKEKRTAIHIMDILVIPMIEIVKEIEIMIELEIEIGKEIIIKVIDIQNIEIRNQVIVLLQNIKKVDQAHLQIHIHLITILNLNQIQGIQVKKKKVLQKIQISLC